MRQSDVAIVGGGIIGAATAYALTERRPDLSVTIVEAEDRLAGHQSGRNTGVVHSGVYCKPGTLLARLCVEGREALFRFCAEHGIAHERCGKVIVATDDEEVPALQGMMNRGRALGMEGLRFLSSAEIREHEPNLAGKMGLHVPDAGIVDYTGVTRRLAGLAEERGGVVLSRARVQKVRSFDRELALETTRGVVRCRALINCAGLRADHVARLCGVDPQLQIIPFQIVFWELQTGGPKHAPPPVRSLIYTVPPRQLAYLGWHVVRTLAGKIEAVPNPSFIHKREGYERWNFALDDTLQMWRYRGFWKMVFRYGLASIRLRRRFATRARLLAEVRRLLPEAPIADVRRGRVGVHAQALSPDGEPIKELVIVESARMIHVLNAPSPAATASLVIGRAVASMAARNLEPARTVVAVRTA